MNFEKFKSEYEWVLNVLKSCENKDHLVTCTKLYNTLIHKWSSHLTISKIESFNSVFDRLYKVQKFKMKKT